MRKFSFLLAIVAVFAMSAAAFAATSDDVTSITNNGTSYITTISNNAADMYYLKGAKSDEVTIALTVGLDMITSPDVKAKTKLIEGPTAKIEVTSGDVNKTDKTVSADITATIIVASADKTNPAIKSPDLKIRVAAADKAASLDLVVTLREFDLVPTKSVVENTKGEIVVEFTDVEFNKSIDIKASSKNVSADIKNGQIVLTNLKAKADEKISFDLVISKDAISYNGLPVIAYNGEDEITKTVEITVAADKNAKALTDVIAAAATDKVTLLADGYNPAGDSATEIDPTTRATLQATLSADLDPSAVIIGSTTVDAVVPEGGYTVIASADVADITVGSIEEGETLRFVKFFTATKGAELAVKAWNDVAFPYNVVIIDDVAPDAYKYTNPNGTKDDFGCLKSDATGTLYVWDGVKDKVASDPIVAVKTTDPQGGSSSGACDMGFGLVAFAGLAALALRKRSK